MIVHPEVAEYVMTSLAGVRSAPVKNTAIALSELGVRPPLTKEVSVQIGGGRVCLCVCTGDGDDLSKKDAQINTYYYILSHR